MRRYLVFSPYARRIGYKFMRFSAVSAFAETVVLFGHRIHVSELGNIMYAATGTAWRIRRRPLLAFGTLVAAASPTGGIDSVEDAAGVLAGMLIGQSADLSEEAVRRLLEARAPAAPSRRGDPRSMTLLRILARSAFVRLTPALLAGFFPGRTFLEVMSERHGGRAVARVQLSAETPHSDFETRSPTEWKRTRGGWFDVYAGLHGPTIDRTELDTAIKHARRGWGSRK